MSDMYMCGWTVVLVRWTGETCMLPVWRQRDRFYITFKALFRASLNAMMYGRISS